ncbi:hypothetical protein CHU95_20030 [Niveispirillum lacus]|uniref:Uncharacterized protein n=1 Tax=Niveispirillum lacus TaxID=1981099 RepID=A0A255YQE3_9PROT|nr:hypothetical protein [Niveispirillum lacus]OYQ31442.1 hypothetical protein CHU95_20030 [Niveispirillum lacus]
MPASIFAALPALTIGAFADRQAWTWRASPSSAGTPIRLIFRADAVVVDVQDGVEYQSTAPMATISADAAPGIAEGHSLISPDGHIYKVRTVAEPAGGLVVCRLSRS